MLFDKESEEVTDMLFKQMKKYKEPYPNYIYALTMGLGKTILMATCIFYEFLLAINTQRMTGSVTMPLYSHPIRQSYSL